MSSYLTIRVNKSVICCRSRNTMLYQCCKNVPFDKYVAITRKDITYALQDLNEIMETLENRRTDILYVIDHAKGMEADDCMDLMREARECEKELKQAHDAQSILCLLDEALEYNEDLKQYQLDAEDEVSLVLEWRKD